jgi:hypothetical protein
MECTSTKRDGNCRSMDSAIGYTMYYYYYYYYYYLEICELHANKTGILHTPTIYIHNIFLTDEYSVTILAFKLMWVK